MNTPHKPHKPSKKARRPGPSELLEPEFVVLNGRLLVAAVPSRKERSITADLYRNLSEYRRNAAMERKVRL